MSKQNSPTLLNLAILLVLLFGFNHLCYAREDVIYLKNGSTYRGVIVAETPGLNYTIRLHGGYEVVVSDKVVQRVKREPEKGPAENVYDSSEMRYEKVHYKSAYFFYRERGFCFQWQTIVGLIDGMRFLFGYKFNPYAALTGGLGFEYANTLTDAPYPVSNGYFPFFVSLTGDVLKARLTPVYYAEVGYTVVMNRNLQTPSEDGYYRSPPSFYVSYGGVTSGVGFGLRRYMRHANVLLSLNANAGYLKIKSSDFNGSYNHLTGQLYYTDTTKLWLIVQPSLRFAVCFN
jgi:hypothetical protein